jgi:hypothetical protein
MQSTVTAIWALYVQARTATGKHHTRAAAQANTLIATLRYAAVIPVNTETSEMHTTVPGWATSLPGAEFLSIM